MDYLISSLCGLLSVVIFPTRIKTCPSASSKTSPGVCALVDIVMYHGVNLLYYMLLLRSDLDRILRLTETLHKDNHISLA